LKCIECSGYGINTTYGILTIVDFFSQLSGNEALGPRPSIRIAAAPAAGAKYKKAPDAPKRFKSAFIIFSAEKHKEIKENYAKEGRIEKVSSHFS
jgi:hypothetical protein